MVRIKIGLESFETSRAKDSGTKAAYTEEFAFYFDGSAVNAGLSVDVEVLNKSLLGKEESLGKGKIQIKEVMRSLGSSELVTFNLQDGSSPNGGKLTLMPLPPQQ
jgi:hypothetical protein